MFDADLPSPHTELIHFAVPQVPLYSGTTKSPTKPVHRKTRQYNMVVNSRTIVVIA